MCEASAMISIAGVNISTSFCMQAGDTLLPLRHCCVVLLHLPCCRNSHRKTLMQLCQDGKPR